MGLIRGFHAASVTGKIAFILLLVAVLFSWLTFTMNDWGLMDQEVSNDGNKIGYGVWRACGNQEPNPNCQDLDGWNLAWYGAFQAFTTIGFLCVHVAFLMSILTMFVPQCLGSRDLGLVCAIASFFGACSYLIAIIIFGANWDSTYDFDFDRETFGPAFYLAIVTVLLAAAAGCCALGGLRGNQQVGNAGPHGSNPGQGSPDKGPRDVEDGRQQSGP